jgi:hypothetical protein
MNGVGQNTGNYDPSHIGIKSNDPSFSHGEPYRLTLTTFDKDCHNDFQEVFVVYKETNDGGPQCRWNMISCTKRKPSPGAPNSVIGEIDVELLALSPVDAGFLGTLIRVLPSRALRKLIRSLLFRIRLLLFKGPGYGTGTCPVIASNNDTPNPNQPPRVPVAGAGAAPLVVPKARHFVYVTDIISLYEV